MLAYTLGSSRTTISYLALDKWGAGPLSATIACCWHVRPEPLIGQLYTCCVQHAPTHSALLFRFSPAGTMQSRHYSLRIVPLVPCRNDTVTSFFEDQASWAHDKACGAVPALRTHPKLIMVGTSSVVLTVSYYYMR